MKADVTSRAQAIRLALFDVDGVMTDGTLYVSEAGESFKPFNILDGLGLKLLKLSGVTTGIITGRTSAAVRARSHELSIDHLVQGAENKLDTYTRLRDELGLNDAQVSYMGDDLPDLPVLRRCGLAISPPEAVALVRDHVHVITGTSAGKGAVREACELIMRAQGTWQAQLERFLA